MNKRLVWNFEININKPLQLPDNDSLLDSSEIRWESRFFWLDNTIIVLNGLNETFLNLSQYKIKARNDIYYLLPHADYNLKTRHDTLIYKPILKKTLRAVGFGKKIKVDDQNPNKILPGLDNLTQATQIHVEKEAIIYTFASSPKIKFEMARLKIADKTFFSASFESRSQLFVESITEQLLGDIISCDYITFLKTI